MATSNPNKNLLEALNVAGQVFAAGVIAELKKAKKTNTGKLVNSITFRVNQSTLSIEILGADYLKYVDKGRRPGATPPPVSKILPWVKSKKLKFGKSDLQTAFIVARSIGKKGIKPTNVINKAKLTTRKQVSSLIAAGAGKDLEIKVRGIFIEE